MAYKYFKIPAANGTYLSQSFTPEASQTDIIFSGAIDINAFDDFGDPVDTSTLTGSIQLWGQYTEYGPLSPIPTNTTDLSNLMVFPPIPFQFEGPVAYIRASMLEVTGCAYIILVLIVGGS
jgi:hypothetical protein